MAEHPNLRRQTSRTWLSSQEFRTRSNSQSSPSSPPGANGYPSLGNLTDDRFWYKKIACCHLESLKGEGMGQAIIVCLGSDGDRSPLADVLEISMLPALVLITNHHIIPSRRHVQKWKLLISSEKDNKTISLNEAKFLNCVSCCGRDGVLGEIVHEKKECPFQADFTLLPLSENFASKEILSKLDLFFPVVMPLSMESLKDALKSQRFYIFQRDEINGGIREVEVDIQKITPPTDDTASIRGLIEDYRKMCTLSYNKCPEVRRGCSGAGLFFKIGEERVLLGLHVSTSDDGRVHYGTSIHKIFHAIADGSVCGFVPSLSLLKEAQIYDCLKLASYKKLLDYLEPARNLHVAAVHPIQVNAGGQDISSRHLLELLHYLIVEKLIIIDQNNDLSLPSIKLVAAVFRLFGSRFTGHVHIKEEIEKVFKDEVERNGFYTKVKEVVEKVYNILRSCHQAELLESCFHFWHKSSFFPLPELCRDSTKFAKLRQVRDEHMDNTAIQCSFADICLAYQSQLKTKHDKEMTEKEAECRQQLQIMREEWDKEKTELEMRARDQIRQREYQLEEQIRDLEEQVKQLEGQIRQLNTQAESDGTENVTLRKKLQEVEQTREDLSRQLDHSEQRGVERELAIEQLKERNSDLNSENETQAQEISSNKRHIEILNQKISTLKEEAANSMSRSQVLTPVFGTPPIGKYPARSSSASLLSPDYEVSQDFWNRDMSELLKEDTTLREKIASFLKKTPGDIGTTSWEHMIDNLQKKDLLKMDVAGLDGTDVAGILMSILMAWRKKEKVTIRKFCDLCNELGVRAVEEEMRQAERNNRNSISHNV